MSLIPGDSGSKTVLTDGVQVDHLSENTVGHGVRVRGISDPTTYPVLIGDVGESIGTIRNGTNGYTYSTRTTTCSGVAFTDLTGGVLLKKGVYVISGASSFYKAAANTCYSHIRIGNTQVTTDVKQRCIAGDFASITIPAILITITTDDTAVAMYGAGDAANTTQTNETFIFRIA